MTKRQRLKGAAKRAIVIVCRLALLLILLALLGWVAVWLGSYPLFRPIASVGFGLFACALLTLAFDAIRTAYLGWKAGK